MANIQFKLYGIVEFSGIITGYNPWEAQFSQQL